jgi:hypothetical protein
VSFWQIAVIIAAGYAIAVAGINLGLRHRIGREARLNTVITLIVVPIAVLAAAALIVALGLIFLRATSD